MEATPGVIYPVATDVDAHDAHELGDEFAALHEALGKVSADPSPSNLAALEACWKRLCSHVRATEAEATAGSEARAAAVAANHAKRVRREAAEAAEADRLAEEQAKLDAERAERQTRAANKALEERAAGLAAEVARLAAGGGGRRRASATAASRAKKRQNSRNLQHRKAFDAAKELRYGQLDRRSQALQQFMEAEGDEGAFEEWLAESEDFAAEEVQVSEDPKPEFDRKIAESEEQYERDMEDAEGEGEEE